MSLPDPIPEIYFGGSSPAAIGVAARHADVYLTWGEPLAQVKEKIHAVGARAVELGRHLRFGIRLHTISRDRALDAWAVADGLLAGLAPERIAEAQAGLAGSESEGQRRMRALHGSVSRLMTFSIR